MTDRDVGAETVSVIIPAYNSAATIRRALDSVLIQSRPPEQILVIDDGSTDGTGVVVSEYGGRIQYFWQPNAGPGAARNTGIREATETWIAFLDADDEWLPDRLHRQFEILRDHPNLAWVTGNYLRRDSQGRSQSNFVALPGSSLPNRMSFFDAFVRNRWGWTGTLLIRREVFERVGVFLCEPRFTEDFDMWFRIAFDSPEIGIVDEPLAVYHVDTPDSLIKGQLWNVDAMVQFLSRNLRLAGDRGKTAEFVPCASLLLRKWIRGMLFAGQASEARRLSSQFGKLLTRPMRLAVWMASLCPPLTTVLLRLASRLARATGIRRGPTRTRSKTGTIKSAVSR